MKNKIREIRKNEDVTQDKYAKRYGISRKTLSEIENGKCGINLDLAFRISTDHGLSVDEVFENQYSFNSKANFEYEEFRKKRYEKWISNFVSFWKNKEENIILLFSENCEYYDSPFNKIESKEELYKVWKDNRDRVIKRLQYEILGYQNNSCIARLILKELNGSTLDMICLLELNINNICTKFMKWENIN